MSAAKDPLRDLIDALSLAPDNLPLRQHVVESLVRAERIEEAESLARQGLKLAPESERLKIGLARCFLAKGENSKALVIAEDLVRRPDVGIDALLLFANLALRAGESARAEGAWRKALATDPNVVDADLEGAFGRFDRKAERRDQPSEPSWTPEDDADDGRMREAVDGGEDHPGVEIEKPDVRFRDVGGMEAVKEEIRLKVIHPLTHAELYRAYGKKIGGGILLYGPPGCGKTHIARATAGEVDARFIAVGIHDILDMWIGSSEQRLHAVFEAARENTPCVVFFDEVDALAAARTDMRQASGRHVINQFLQELDGVQSSNEGVLVLAATNAPWHLDTAFRRPGRFDRVVFVPPPDHAARVEILKIMVEKKPTTAIDYDDVAKRCEGFSGADLKAVVDLSIEAKLSEAMKKGVPMPIATKDLFAAAKRHAPTTKEWFATARNYALFANQGGIYDDILKYLKLS